MNETNLVSQRYRSKLFNEVVEINLTREKMSNVCVVYCDLKWSKIYVRNFVSHITERSAGSRYFKAKSHAFSSWLFCCQVTRRAVAMRSYEQQREL